MRTAVVFAATVIALLGARVSDAQETHAADRPWIADVSRWGRWVALGGAAGLIAAAAEQHGAASGDYDRLAALCNENPAACTLTAGGTSYPDPAAEQLYQRWSRHERNARGYLLGGQAALLAAGAMFVIDLIYTEHQPPNIPLTPFTVYRRGDRLGLAISF